MSQYKAASLAGQNSAFMQCFGNAVTEDDTATPPVALLINDTVDLLRIAGGTRLQELLSWHGDFDTGTTAVYKIGYRSAQSDGVLAANDSAFGTGLTDLQAAVLSGAPTRYAFQPIEFNEDVIIFATITTAPTGTSGTPGWTLLARGKARGTK